MKFEDEGVFNPACIKAGENIHMFYRATRKENYSTLGYCLLENPLKIKHRYDKPVLLPEDGIKGIEDPRITKIDDTYYLTYTVYDGVNARGALATSKDLKIFCKEGFLTPEFTYEEFKRLAEVDSKVREKYFRHFELYRERGLLNDGKKRPKLLIWDKNVIFFPKKINGKLAYLHRIRPGIQLVLINSLKDLSREFWEQYFMNFSNYIVLDPKYQFEASYIGGGCPPIETKDGWLLIYHAVQDTPKGYVYSAGAALLDLKDPTKEIGRLRTPLFSPKLKWEKEGVVNNVVFPTGAIMQDDTLYIYYGAADERIGVASTKLSELLDKLKRTYHATYHN
ncbi:hypothetical protein QQ008_21145 [Fulvivirgaceae bacterium BMA10]|uniref:Pesticidal protein Cry7Aa n=1 Tax=Splendidivirga corallicola TaxID=3051826 RepID=A0ABT8KVE1_9BACT|nr:hypothetical protein [Fulvivirgaceae bacterium BMA10]